MEFVNDMFVMAAAYFMILFTEFVPDVETRQILGEVFYNTIYAIIGYNVLVIIINLIIGFIK